MTSEIALLRHKVRGTILAWARWLSSARLMVLTIIYLLAICGIFAAVLLSECQDVWAQTLRQAGNLSAALRQDFARNVELYDLSLQEVVDGWESPKVRAQEPELRQKILFDRAATAHDLGAILVLDAQGNVVANSTGLALRHANLADKDYFKIHAAKPDAGLFLSQPFTDGAADRWSVGLSRRINAKDGSFDGVVVGTIELDYLRTQFEGFALSANDSITLMRQDGSVLMRRPYDGDTIGRSLPTSAEVFGGFKADATGHFVHKSPVDGVERLFVYGQVGSLPLLQIVGISTEDISAPWLRKALMTAGAVLVLCAAVIALTLLLGVQLRARAVVEEHLTKLAERDPLTALFNRRRFDEAMQVEWSRAVRNRSCLSVLMLDVDCFKLYNDTFGHQMGDAALQAVAARTQASVQRATDIVGRYGGEEFAILLPGSNAEAAAGIAERVRLAVTDLAIAHCGSPHGVITVSIGVASIYPVFGDQPTLLIRQADAVLYAAKGAGRNRVVCSELSEAMRAAA